MDTNEEEDFEAAVVTEEITDEALLGDSALPA